MLGYDETTMIASIEGVIKYKDNKFIIIDVAGVGYKIFCPSLMLEKIKESESIELFTHLYIRESIMDLYGFLSLEELELFELLISVSGIGPKAGLGVMSTAPIKNIKTSISSGQVSLLIKVAGIGKKTAERVILELGNKILTSPKEISKLMADDEAVDALISLGYSQKQAREALNKVSGKNTSEKVKNALKAMGKS